MGRLTTRQLTSKRNRKKKLSQKTSLQPGDMLQDRYRIVGTLGVGGFSSVYQARDMRFSNVTKLCAIKEMVISAPDPQIRELTIKSFEREASMLAMLDHPSIPDISDYFTEKDRSYLVIDLIRGKDLEAWLDDQIDPLDQETALDWALQLCNVLSHLHNQKPQPIVFRDMKPSNIMLDQYNRIRIIDFGIAKLFETDRKGTMIGTEGYSPPEQYRGQATPAGDVYALGATFHHLLTRQDPRLEPPFTFAERPINAVNKHVTPAFEAVIMRCLAYDPNDRYKDAGALKEALELVTRASSAASAAPVAAPPPDGAAAVAPVASVTPVAETQVVADEPAESLVKPLWTFKCEDEIRSKAAVTKDLVLVGAYDNNLYALSREKGEFVWKFPASDGIGSSPYVHDNSVLIGSVDKHLYSLNLKNGRVNWRFAANAPIYSSPVVRFDHIFFGSDDGNLYALSSQGRLVWKANAYGPVRSTPYVDDEFIYFGTEGGYIYCLELANGKVKWQSQAKRAVTSSPTVAEDIVLVGSMDSTIYALDAGSGWTIWRTRVRRPIISSPVIQGDFVYIGSSDGNLYCLDLVTGRQIWTYETNGQVTSSPATWENSVYVGSTDGNVYCLGLKKGDLRWQFQTSGAITSPPAIADGVVYIGSVNNILYALPA
ncbi:MAG: serine/threonine-protein kinase [Chloroflexi bacterium]|nr:serine/threonine-protein kinase [Chloroflexota bacterium]